MLCFCLTGGEMAFSPIVSRANMVRMLTGRRLCWPSYLVLVFKGKAINQRVWKCGNVLYMCSAPFEGGGNQCCSCWGVNAQDSHFCIHISTWSTWYFIVIQQKRHMYTNQCMANDALIINLLFLESALGNTPVSHFHSIFIPCLNPLHNWPCTDYCCQCSE